ncbi:hypothetical protein BpHYR1_045652 [Brachionus plicatilis]|uniref:Uncharacterized protein n=1 Tax=Brachionus plicatilis TaxID=10195 RepID=A0A3M7PFQ4_BRAPC|nr:hypothetical protein BpHYR1_045652 [Brachionus plicatilis]
MENCLFCTRLDLASCVPKVNNLVDRRTKLWRGIASLKTKHKKFLFFWLTEILAMVHDDMSEWFSTLFKILIIVSVKKSQFKEILTSVEDIMHPWRRLRKIADSSLHNNYLVIFSSLISILKLKEYFCKEHVYRSHRKLKSFHTFITQVDPTNSTPNTHVRLKHILDPTNYLITGQKKNFTTNNQKLMKLLDLLRAKKKEKRKKIKRALGEFMECFNVYLELFKSLVLCGQKLNALSDNLKIRIKILKQQQQENNKKNLKI